MKIQRICMSNSIRKTPFLISWKWEYWLGDVTKGYFQVQEDDLRLRAAASVPVVCDKVTATRYMISCFLCGRFIHNLFLFGNSCILFTFP